MEILDPLQVLLRHLRIVVNQHAPELLTRDATRHLVDETRKTSPAVVDELIPDIMKLSDVQRILQRLLSEGVSIRQLSIVLETLGDESDATKSDVELTESVRQRLARTICAQFRDDRERLHVITLDPALEEQIQKAGQLRGRELMLDLPSQQVESICRSIDRELEQLRGQGRPEIVLVTPEIRPMVKRLTRHLLPQIIVLSYAEITAETKVVSLGIVSEADE